MMSRIKSQLNHFLNLHPNSAVMMATEPCWAVPIAWMGVYGPIYMRAAGLTETLIGWVAFCTVLGQLAGVIMGGWLADHWGRKKTLMTFDFICWFIPMGIWYAASYMSHPFPWFALGALIWGFGFIVAPAWYCIFTEGATSEQTHNAFALFWLIISSNGIFAPLGGYFVSRMGMVHGYRLMLAISVVTVAIGWTGRLLKLKEPEPSSDTHEKTDSLDPGNIFHEHWKALQWMWKFPFCRILLFSGLIHAFYAVMWANFAPLYWTDPRGLNLSESMVSLVPAIGSITTFLVILAALPRCRKKNPVIVLLGAGILITAGMSFLLGAPAGMMSILLLYAVLYSAGIGMYGPVRDAQWLLSLTRSDYRAKILALVNFIGIVANLPAGPLGGMLYHSNPQYPFWCCLLLSGLNLFILGGFFLWQKKFSSPSEK